MLLDVSTDEALVDTREVCKTLKVSERWVKAQVAKEQRQEGTGLPSVKVGGARRFLLSAVKQRINEQQG